MKKVLLVLSLVLLAGCTSPDTATRTLLRSGYKDIVITGWRAFSCGDDYTFSTGFSATALNGEHVTGTVCSGWLKGNSIKLDD